MAVTIYDIAKEVGTSATTVSLALRDSSKISSETVAKVKRVADRLNYRPNITARGLVGSCTKTLAFVFNYPPVDLAHDRSFMQIFHEFAQSAQTLGYKVQFRSVSSVMSVDDIVLEMKSCSVSGMLLVSSFDETAKNAIIESRFPTVLIGRDIISDKLSCVSLDDKNGALKSVEYFCKLGHKRIGFVGKQNNFSSMRRFEGYVSALEKFGIEFNESLVFDCGYDLESGELAGLRIAKLRPMPTAVLAATDMLSFGLIASFREKGIVVPKDISVIGFDNLDLAKISYPTISSVDLSRHKVAKKALDLLVDIIENDKGGIKELVKSRLVIRESTAEPRLI